MLNMISPDIWKLYSPIIVMKICPLWKIIQKSYNMWQRFFTFCFYSFIFFFTTDLSIGIINSFFFFFFSLFNLHLSDMTRFSPPLFLKLSKSYDEVPKFHFHFPIDTPSYWISSFSSWLLKRMFLISSHFTPRSHNFLLYFVNF